MIDHLNVDDAPWANPYAAPISIDPGYGQQGIARTPIYTYSSIVSLLPQPDADVIAIGQTFPYNPLDIAFARYAPSGALDRSFGQQGTVRGSITHEPDQLFDAALLPDGSILAVGWATIGYYAFLAKFGPDGAPDDSFGNLGRVFGPLQVSSYNALAVLPDGGIIAAGRQAASGDPQSDLFVRRYDADGSIDASFRTDLAATALAGATDVALLDDGRFLVTGWANGHLALSRHAADGTPDVDFGEAGTAILANGTASRAQTMALLADGRITVVGTRWTDAGSDVFVARFLPDGTPDGSFGTLGATAIELPGYQQATGIGLFPDGSLVAVAMASGSSPRGTVIVRLDAQGGHYDPWGDGNGTPRILDLGDMAAHALALAPDNSILLGGSIPLADTYHTQFALTRLQFDSPLVLALDATVPFVRTIPKDFFIDPEGQPLAYRAERADGLPLPRWLAFDPVTSVLSGVPAEEDAGAHLLALYASDGTSETQSTLTFMIRPQHGVLGTPLSETLEGTDAADTLAGAGGTDQLFGGPGDDLLKGGEGADLLHGGAGTDTAVFDGRSDQYVHFMHSGRLHVVDRLSDRDATDSITEVEHLRFLADGRAIDLAATHVASVLEYIASYDDLIAGFGTDEALGYAHLLGSGLAEQRAAVFNGLEYIASYADLISGLGADARAGALHYIHAGQAEERSTHFDSLAYIAANPDLIAGFGANADLGATHFIVTGHAESRPTTFDTARYLANYADLRAGFGDDTVLATSHYIQAGHHEGRTDQAL